jgi:hypothetical protein
MYATLQERQKRYDIADAMEREAKKSVSAFSSPIKEHSTYLETKKQEYLNQAMILHKSVPDKGTPEFTRKLTDLVDGFVADPNIQLIKSSADEWVKGRETAAKLMADGKYSTYQDRHNLNFTGIDPQTGALQRYTFAGIKPKVDYIKGFEDVVKNTPKQSFDVKVARPDGTETRRKQVVKSKSAIEGGLNTYLAMNPDAIGEMAADLGLDSKGIKKYISVFAANGQEIETVSEDGFNAATAKYFDEKRKEQEEAAALAVPLSTIPNTTFRETQEQLKQYVDANGNIIPAKENPMIIGGASVFGTTPDLSAYSNASKQNGFASKQEKISRSISQVERLVREKHKDVYENFLHSRRGNKELALKDAIAYIQEQKEGAPVYGTTIDDDDQRANIKEAFFGNPASVMLYSLNAKTEKDKEPKVLADVLGTDAKVTDMHIGAKLTASPYGRDKNTGLPLQTYSVSIGNQPYVATFGTLNPRDEQAQALYEVETLGKSAIIHNFEPDPENYPELGNRRVKKMRVYLNRLSNGQYAVCGDDVSGQ